MAHATNYNRNDYFDFSTLYLGTIHSSTNLYLVPQSLPRNEEEGKGVTNFFFITSSSSFISSNQLEGFSISGNNLLSRWNGSWLNEFISVGQNPFVTVTITSSSVLVRLVMISHWTSPRLARSVGNTIHYTGTLTVITNCYNIGILSGGWEVRGVALVGFVMF